MNKIKNINVTDASTNEKVTIPSAISSIYYSDKNNLTIETTADDVVGGKGGKINIESVDDIQIKPGDDVIFYSHHRAEGKLDEVALKFTDGDDIPVKVQVNASEAVLTTKDKTGSNSNVFDLTINSGKDQRGYLKVRAQAIDLRSESHGGIALQPKGHDGEGHMNKIKFEHGGGDGLEFGTFNTEKTSIYTDEYRFNKHGIWKMAEREMTDSDKADANDATTAKKYVKQSDDFYDIIDAEDEIADTNAIIKTANVFNYGKNRRAKITDSGNIEISTNRTYTFKKAESSNLSLITFSSNTDPSIIFEEDVTYSYSDVNNSGLMLDDVVFGDAITTSLTIRINSMQSGKLPVCYRVTVTKAPKIKLESQNEINLESSDKIELKSATDVRIKLPVEVEGIPGTGILSMKDVFDAITWMKSNNVGPWELAPTAANE